MIKEKKEIIILLKEERRKKEPNKDIIKYLESLLF